MVVDVFESEESFLHGEQSENEDLSVGPAEWEDLQELQDGETRLESSEFVDLDGVECVCIAARAQGHM